MHHPKSPFSAVAKVAVSHKARASMVAAMRETLPPYPKNDGFLNIREIITTTPGYTHSDVQHFLQQSTSGKG
ncbi:hypothetical protein [Ralstonia edaphi]|uniref:hypothetical protein n=1 Tax=Ralstonia edaphi TaxID=3058599 RepID=UPI00292D7145|nr:hypothetical protein [Ralstonia sp. LMG 6871]